VAAIILSASILLGSPSGVQALTIDVATGAGVTQAIASAVTLGARQWERVLSDPIAVEIEVSMASFDDPAVLATTSAVFLEADYSTIRQAMLVESPELLPLLPAEPVAATLPPGFALSSSVEATKANLKALGLVGLDADFGTSDASILLSDSAAFDFDPRDGITAGRIDLQGLVAHEVAHVLGFVSAVDWVDAVMGDPVGPRTVAPTPLDLFRFAADSIAVDPDELASVPRNLVPGTGAVFRSGGSEAYAFSTGQANGDGRQASHWKDDELTGAWIGLADPTLGRGEHLLISSADVEALDAIGWNAVPEPSVGVLMAVGLAALSRFQTRERRGVPARVRCGAPRSFKLRNALPGQTRVGLPSTAEICSDPGSGSVGGAAPPPWWLSGSWPGTRTPRGGGWRDGPRSNSLRVRAGSPRLAFRNCEGAADRCELNTRSNWVSAGGCACAGRDNAG